MSPHECHEVSTSTFRRMQATVYNPDRSVHANKALCDAAYNQHGGFLGPFIE